MFDRTGSINSLGCSNETAALLTQLYGVDQGSLKKNLELFLGSSSKRKDLTERRRTEIKNWFNEAYQFLEQAHFPKGVQLLQELEVKFM